MYRFLVAVCKEKPDLLTAPWPFEVCISALPCQSKTGAKLIKNLLEPLGYQLTINEYPLNEKNPAWGNAQTYTVTLKKNLFFERLALSPIRTHSSAGQSKTLLDCELMPWSAKAQELIKEQYASVGAAAQSSLSMSVQLLEKALKNNPEVADLYSKFTHKLEMVNDYIRSYERYCWPITSIEDYKLAPFHILASEGHVHVEKDHGWHMDMISQLVAADSSLFKKTQFKIVHIEDAQSCEEAVNWWLQLTEQQGGEGFVIKPYDFTVVGTHGLIQPGLKCRGREYLRIIYGPEYTTQENLDRVKVRNVAKKRSLALREYALGIEALERFVKKEPLYRCHEAVFGILALESEPIDPRL